MGKPAQGTGPPSSTSAVLWLCCAHRAGCREQGTRGPAPRHAWACARSPGLPPPLTGRPPQRSAPGGCRSRGCCGPPHLCQTAPGCKSRPARRQTGGLRARAFPKEENIMMNRVFQKADKTSANIGMIVSNVKREERAGGAGWALRRRRPLRGEAAGPGAQPPVMKRCTVCRSSSPTRLQPATCTPRPPSWHTLRAVLQPPTRVPRPLVQLHKDAVRDAKGGQVFLLGVAIHREGGPRHNKEPGADGLQARGVRGDGGGPVLGGWEHWAPSRGPAPLGDGQRIPDEAVHQPQLLTAGCCAGESGGRASPSRRLPTLSRAGNWGGVANQVTGRAAQRCCATWLQCNPAWYWNL